MGNSNTFSRDVRAAKSNKGVAKPKDKIIGNSSTEDWLDAFDTDEERSREGYKDTSRFRNEPYNNIYTPTGMIDMSETGIPLMANGQYLPPYSGIHNMGTPYVTEERMARYGGGLPKAQVGKQKGNPISDWWYNNEDVQSTYKMAPDVDPFLYNWLQHPETQKRLKENLNSSVITRDINQKNLTKETLKRLATLPMFSRELVKKSGITQNDIEYNNSLQGWKTPNTILNNPYFSGRSGELGVYMPGYHTSMVNTFKNPGVVIHEQTHATGPFQGTMENVIFDKYFDKKNPDKKFVEQFGEYNYDKHYNRVHDSLEKVKQKYPSIYNDFKEREKYLDDDGMYPRIMDIRRSLNLKPGEKVDKSILDNSAIDLPIEDLRHYYDDDTIIDMLNTLAKNNQTKDLNTAAYGGDPSLTNIEGHYPFGGQNTKTHMAEGGWLDQYAPGGTPGRPPVKRSSFPTGPGRYSSNQGYVDADRVSQNSRWFNPEAAIEEYLGYPQEYGAQASEIGNGPPVDNIRHSVASYKTAKAIADKTKPYLGNNFGKAAGVIGANVLGLAHEIQRFPNQMDDVFQGGRPFWNTIEENRQDLKNNLYGSLQVFNDMTPGGTTEYLKQLSKKGKLAKGTVDDNAYNGNPVLPKQERVLNDNTRVVRRDGGALAKFQNVGPVTPNTLNANDFIYSPEELSKFKGIYDQRFARCEEGDAGCLEQANNYYNLFVAPKLGMDNTWTTANKMGISSGPNNPRMKEYGETADSWDLPGLYKKAGAKVYLAASPDKPFEQQEMLNKMSPQESKDYWKKMNLPIGTLVNFGTTGLDKMHGLGLAYNTTQGLVPANHSARVAGYDAEGVPYIYDYGKLTPITDPTFKLSFPLVSITAPQEIQGYTFENLNKQNKLQADRMFPLTLNTKNAEYDEDEYDPFINSLTKNKESYANAFGMTNEEYDDYAKHAAALALTETGGGDDTSVRWKGIIPVPSYVTDKMGIGDTKGITQINAKVLFGKKSLADKLSVLGITKDNFDPWNSDHIAAATMALLKDNRSVQNANAKKAGNKADLSEAEKTYYQWSMPGTLVKGQAKGDSEKIKRYLENYGKIQANFQTSASPIAEKEMGGESGWLDEHDLPKAQPGLQAASTYPSAKEQNTLSSMPDKRRVYEQNLANEKANREYNAVKGGLNVAGLFYYPASVAASALEFSEGNYGQGAVGLVPFVGPASRANTARNILNQASRNLLTKSYNAGIPYKIAAPIIKGAKKTTMYGANAVNAQDAYDAFTDLDEQRYGGVKKYKGLPKGTTKNIVSGINKLFLPDPKLFGPFGRKVFDPNSKFEDGGWLDEYQDGGNKKGTEQNPFQLPEVVTTPWTGSILNYEDANPKESYINNLKQAYLNNRNTQGLNKLAGLSMENFPSNVEQEYANEYLYKRNNSLAPKIIDSYSKSGDRTEWVDKLTEEEKDIIKNSDYRFDLEPNSFATSAAGLSKIFNYTGMPERYNAKMLGITENENKDIGKLNTLDFMNVPGQALGSTLRSPNLPGNPNNAYMNNSMMKGLQGYHDPKRLAGEEFLANPLNWTTGYDVAAISPIIGKGLLKGLKGLRRKPVQNAAFDPNHYEFSNPEMTDYFAQQPKRDLAEARIYEKKAAEEEAWLQQAEQDRQDALASQYSDDELENGIDLFGDSDDPFGNYQNAVNARTTNNNADNILNTSQAIRTQAIRDFLQRDTPNAEQFVTRPSSIPPPPTYEQYLDNASSIGTTPLSREQYEYINNTPTPTSQSVFPLDASGWPDPSVQTSPTGGYQSGSYVGTTPNVQPTPRIIGQIDLSNIRNTTRTAAPVGYSQTAIDEARRAFWNNNGPFTAPSAEQVALLEKHGYGSPPAPKDDWADITENLKQNKKSTKAVETVKKELARDKNTTGRVNYSDVDSSDKHTLLDKSVIPSSDKLDDLINNFEEVLNHTPQDHNLRNKLVTQVEDLKSTKWLREEYAKELELQGLKPQKDLSIVTSHSGYTSLKHLVDSEGNIIASIDIDPKGYVGSSGLAHDYHGANLKRLNFEDEVAAQTALEERLKTRNLEALQNSFDRGYLDRNAFDNYKIGTESSAKKEAAETMARILRNNNNKYGEALYRGVHHGIKDTKGGLKSHKHFVHTSLKNPITDEIETAKRGKLGWTSWMKQGKAADELDPNGIEQFRMIRSLFPYLGAGYLGSKALEEQKYGGWLDSYK